jgi:Skp family chaperone for outer membrane proteins
MEMKVSKTSLTLLIIALTALFMASNIMYGKANETILIHIVDQQNIATNKLVSRVFTIQKDLDKAERELENTKKELESTKKELNDANNKIVILKTAVPEAAAQ